MEGGKLECAKNPDTTISQLVSKASIELASHSVLLSVTQTFVKCTNPTAFNNSYCGKFFSLLFISVGLAESRKESRDSWLQGRALNWFSFHLFYRVTAYLWACA